MNCSHTDDSFDRCWRQPTTVVEHRDGEHLPYCTQHAAIFERLPRRSLADEAELLRDVKRADLPPDHAIRASLLHAVANTSDQHTRSIDPPCQPQTTPEHVTALAVSLGDVARCEDARELQDALVEHAALTLCWLEAAIREQAAWSEPRVRRPAHVPGVDPYPLGDLAQRTSVLFHIADTTDPDEVPLCAAPSLVSEGKIYAIRVARLDGRHLTVDDYQWIRRCLGLRDDREENATGRKERGREDG